MKDWFRDNWLFVILCLITLPVAAGCMYAVMDAIAPLE